MNSKDFKEIENFFDAYRARFREMFWLTKNGSDKKILIMHLGGIVIECLLKYRVIKEKNFVKKYKEEFWYTQARLDTLLSIRNATKTHRRENGIANPGHKLIEIARLDNILNTKINNEERFVNDLEILYNPLERKNGSFIDLRYISDDEVEDLDNRFNKWNEVFNRMHDEIKL